jgi:hypothetical protein
MDQDIVNSMTFPGLLWLEHGLPARTVLCSVSDRHSRGGSSEAPKLDTV